MLSQKDLLNLLKKNGVREAIETRLDGVIADPFNTGSKVMNVCLRYTILDAIDDYANEDRTINAKSLQQDIEDKVETDLEPLVDEIKDIKAFIQDETSRIIFNDLDDLLEYYDVTPKEALTDWSLDGSEFDNYFYAEDDTIYSFDELVEYVRDNIDISTIIQERTGLDNIGRTAFQLFIEILDFIAEQNNIKEDVDVEMQNTLEKEIKDTQEQLISYINMVANQNTFEALEALRNTSDTICKYINDYVFKSCDKSVSNSVRTTDNCEDELEFWGDLLIDEDDFEDEGK